MRAPRPIWCVIVIWIALQVAATAAMPWAQCCAEGHHTNTGTRGHLCDHDAGESHAGHGTAGVEHHSSPSSAPSAGHHHAGEETRAALRCLCGISADTLGLILNGHAILPAQLALDGTPNRACIDLAPLSVPDRRSSTDTPPPRV